MAQQILNIGSTVNDGTGDTLRTGAQKINANFAELYLTTIPTQVGNSGKFLTTNGVGTIWATIDDQISAAANNLTGTTLASSVVTSSLTTVGTLTNLTVTNPIAGSITGNANTVSNGIYTTTTYQNPTWLGSLAGSKITGNISGNAGTVTNGVYTNQIYDNPDWISSLATRKVLPSPVGNAGKFLTTNGSADNAGFTWSNITSLPGGAPNKILYQSGIGVTNFIAAPGSAGTFLKWNGSTFEWTATGAGQGTVTQVQGSGTVSGITLSGNVTSTGNLTLGGALTLSSGQVTSALGFTPLQLTSLSVNVNSASGTGYLTFDNVTGIFTFTPPAPPTGTVSTVSVATANGFTGTVATATSTPAISIGTTISGLLKGNGTSISSAVAGTDYLLPYGLTNANYILASPNAASGYPSFRALVATDIPVLNQNTTGSAAKLTVARNINGQAFDGTADITVTVSASSGITGLAGSMASFLTGGTSATLAAAITDETGSGSLVFGTTPTLATPIVTSSLTTTSSTFSLINGTATTVNFASAATTISIGNTTGTLTVNNANTVLAGTATIASTTLIGPATSANLTRFPGAQVVVSNIASGIQKNETSTNSGIMAEAVGVNAGNYGVGVYGAGYTAGNARGTGVTGEGHVSATGDSASSIGVRGYANDAHTGGSNVGLFGDASGGLNNYALYMNAGDIYSTAAQTWTLGGALTFSGAYKVTIPGGVAINGAGTLGFATGSGGAVTQSTNRSTTVDLNKTNGAITLFNTTATAGQITSFIVTNTTVAATDTIILSQKSGSGIYFCTVSAVGTGSFTISVYTPNAVSSADAPVINFAVIKAVIG
jgi:hypothetical protein